MRDHLTIHDISAYVHTGMNSENYRNYTVQGFPMGGVKYFLKYFTLDLVSMMDVIVAFDSKSFRKEVYEGYKSKRNSDGPNHAVNMQIEFLYEQLLRCNIPCYKEDGFEADDLIFSAVEQNRDKYIKISLVSSDYDITHNVDDVVYFRAVNSNVNDISYRNFSTSIERGVKIQINTISAYHMFCGCDSDGIPKIVTEDGTTGMQLYQEFCKYLVDNMKSYNVHVSRSKEAMVQFLLANKGRFSDHDISLMLRNMKLAYPKNTTEEESTKHVEFEGESIKNIDLDQYARLLSYCYELPALRKINKEKVSLTEDEVQFFRTKAKELSTGEFAVDRGRPVIDDDLTEYSFVNLREF